MSNLQMFQDTDGVQITVGSRLVWRSLYSNAELTGVVSVSPVDSSLIVTSVRGICHVDNLLSDNAWVMVVPAYPKALVSKVA